VDDVVHRALRGVGLLRLSNSSFQPLAPAAATNSGLLLPSTRSDLDEASESATWSISISPSGAVLRRKYWRVCRRDFPFHGRRGDVGDRRVARRPGRLRSHRGFDRAVQPGRCLCMGRTRLDGVSLPAFGGAWTTTAAAPGSSANQAWYGLVLLRRRPTAIRKSIARASRVYRGDLAAVCGPAGSIAQRWHRDSDRPARSTHRRPSRRDNSRCPRNSLRIAVGRRRAVPVIPSLVRRRARGQRLCRQAPPRNAGKDTPSAACAPYIATGRVGTARSETRLRSKPAGPPGNADDRPRRPSVRGTENPSAHAAVFRRNGRRSGIIEMDQVAGFRRFRPGHSAVDGSK